MIDGDFHGEECLRKAYLCCTHIFTSTLVTGLLPILPSFMYGRDREGLSADTLLTGSKNEHLTVRVVVA